MRPFALCVALASASAAAAPLSARVDGEAIVLSQGGREARLPWRGMTHAVLSRVPLRGDGTESAIWASVSVPGGTTGLLVRFADPPTVLYSVPEVQGAARTLVWLLDVDGDGWHDAVAYRSSLTDAGPQNDAPTVHRYDPRAGRFVAGGAALDKRAPRQPPSRDQVLGRLIPKAVHRQDVHRQYEVDGRSDPLPSPQAPDTLGISAGSLPWVGPDVIRLVQAKVPGRKFGGEHHLVHGRLFPGAPAIISTLRLGDVGFPMDGCAGKHDTFSRAGGEIVIVWPITDQSLVEQRVPWDGRRLGKPTAPPHEVARCGLMME